MKRKFIERYPITGKNQENLIEGCKRGEPAAQLQVYKLYYKSVYNICLQIVSDPSRAEDIMQESFLIAFENIGSYFGNVSFSSWITNHIKFAIEK
jgi:DNA-directed RNA polymerase specialized sigma24 family protein